MRLASSGGSSHAKFSAFAALSPAPLMAGTSWSTCSSTATLRRSRSNSRKRRRPKPLLLARVVLRKSPSGTSPQHLSWAASTLHLLHRKVSPGLNLTSNVPLTYGCLGGIDWAAEPTTGGNDWAAEPAAGATGWDAQPSG